MAAKIICLGKNESNDERDIIRDQKIRHDSVSCNIFMIYNIVPTILNAYLHTLDKSGVK